VKRRHEQQLRSRRGVCRENPAGHQDIRLPGDQLRPQVANSPFAREGKNTSSLLLKIGYTGELVIIFLVRGF
jgi:hypothetical protein